MLDYRGTELKVGDKVALYWGYNELVTGRVSKIKGQQVKVKIQTGMAPGDIIESKWKRGSCMVKLPEW